MKKKIFTILFVAMAVVVLPSCREDDAITDLVVESPDHVAGTVDEDDGDIEPGQN